VFGSKPGAYGAGLLPLIDSRDWKSDADLAEVYAVWGGYAYGKDLDGTEARGDMERVYRRVRVAAKNQDTREHDIVDSDDYFQYHGGMVAAVRALTGSSPEAYVGDSAVPDTVKTRTLQEETHRVFRPAWSTRSGSRRCSATATRARSRWPATVDYLFGYDADGRRRRGLDVREARVVRTSSTRPTRPSCRRATRGRCAASPSGCSRRPTAGCGPSRPARRSRAQAHLPRAGGRPRGSVMSGMPPVAGVFHVTARDPRQHLWRSEALRRMLPPDL
jgi:hypothetical protein